MKKLYIGSALFSTPEDYRMEIRKFKDSLKGDFEVLPYLFDIKDTLNNSVTPKEVWEFDTDRVTECDILVAECSYASLGLGYEIRLAIENKKDVIATVKIGRKFSKMIKGIQYDNFYYFEYHNFDELKDYIIRNHKE